MPPTVKVITKVKVPEIKAREYISDKDLSRFMTGSVAEAIKKIREGKLEVALVPKSAKLRARLEKAAVKDGKMMFDWYNKAVHKQWQVPDPTADMILNPHSTQNQALWKPYFAKGRHAGSTEKFAVMNMGDGMVNYYGSYCEDAVLADREVGRLCEEVTGTHKWQAHQNRWRVSQGGPEGPTDIHMEGRFTGTDRVFEEDLSFIVGIGGQRSFVWWEGTAIDPIIRNKVGEAYRRKASRNFALFKGPEVTSLIGNCRSRIVFDAQKYILVFIEGVMHEVDAKYPSTSLFISPFDPQTVTSTHPKERTPFQKNCYQPPAFNNDSLTNRDTEVIGLLYHQPGSYWPSNKISYQYSNTQALFHHYPKMRSRYKRTEHDKISICNQLPDWGKVKGNKAKMAGAGMDGLPEIAYKSGPWVMDPIKRYRPYPMLQWRRGLRTDFPKKSDFRLASRSRKRDQ